MKNFLKNYLKLGILLFLISLVFTNCEKDDDFTTKEPTVKQAQTAKYTTSIVQKTTFNINETLKLALNKFKAVDKSNALNNASKLVINDSLNIAIEDGSAKYLESLDGSYHSYTFVAFDYGKSQGMQNIVLSLQLNGTYKEFLIHYDLTDSEIELYRNNEYVNLLGKVTIVVLEGSSLTGNLFSKLTVDENCLEWDINEGSNCTDVEGHSWEDGNACPHYLTTTQTATPDVNNFLGINWPCVEASNGGSYIPGTNSNNPSNGTQSGAGQPSTSAQQDVSSGYAPTPKQQREKGFQKQLSDEANDCFNSANLTDDQREEIMSFLEAGISVSIDGEILVGNQSSYNQSDMDFAEEAALAFCGGDLVFEDIENLINGMDKNCQALAVFRSISRINSPFTNKIKNYFLLSNTNNLNLQDWSTGETSDEIPTMPANVGARVLHADSDDGTIILQFNNDHLDTATTLGFINTFYHELVHAYMLRLYYSGELLNEYPTYTSLNTAIANFINDDTNDTTFGDLYYKEMHDIYVDFIDQIAESIVAYCVYNNISGVNLQHAVKLVWGGLNGYDVFFDNQNLTDDERIEAQTQLGYENSNITAHAKGTKTCN
ncbi:hypothetical protein [Lacinutrix jangbogonensis]|uniref:hypothetical protein n=1 Tax=Lacinutrix jangbogonensis TaxID=1469557 RepID=UPI00053D3003|nr:hypothetical protein [Lacinutrix jangbogonensis]